MTSEHELWRLSLNIEQHHDQGDVDWQEGVQNFHQLR